MSCIALFVSPHGLGHAARASAVVQALRLRVPELRVAVFTTVPRWFFDESLGAPFSYHHVLTDIGLVQRDPLVEDTEATARLLRELLPFDRDLVVGLAQQLAELQSRLVLCDIAPLGLAVARTAGLPAVLVENFTWDWIYQAYVEECPSLGFAIEELGELLQECVTLHIQTRPCCRPLPGTRSVGPIARPPRCSRRQTRQQLGVPETATLVLLTMGGISWQYDRGLEMLRNHGSAYFVVPGAGDEPCRDSHLLTLPHHSSFYHPDLVHACDVVIGKLGYSTLAEVSHAGASFGFIPRARFPESPVLAEYARHEMAAVEVPEQQFRDGSWLSLLDSLVGTRPPHPPQPDGAAAAAELISELLSAGATMQLPEER